MTSRISREEKDGSLAMSFRGRQNEDVKTRRNKRKERKIKLTLGIHLAHFADGEIKARELVQSSLDTWSQNQDLNLHLSFLLLSVIPLPPAVA